MKFQQDDPLTPDDGEARFFGRSKVGNGRWVTVALGVLWTDNADSLQCDYRPDVDSYEMADFQNLLNAYATAELTATEAFDVVVADEGNPPVTSGDLSYLG